MMRLECKAILVLWVYLLVVALSWGAVIETTIKYVSPQAVYLSAGSNDGVAKGDSADVLRDGQIIAHLEVVFVAQSSSSARILQSERELRIGDQVRLAASAPTLQDSTLHPAAAAETPPATPNSGKVTARRPATQIHGRIASQVFYQDDREATNSDVTKPALILRATVENLFANYLNLSVNLRTRQILRRNAASQTWQSDWDNRIYEVALQYDNPASALNYQVGRISSNRINGIGLFDGALMEYELSGGWSAGIFGGTRPDLQTSAPSSDETTTGLYAAYETGNWTGRQMRGTIAFAGRYHTGQIDEEFIYEQIHYAGSSRFSITQSSEIAVNRGWRQQAEGSTLGLSNMLVNVNYLPTSSLAFDFGYDNRKQMRTYETRDTPDSLFDDALRQGFRAGVSARLPLGLRAWLRGGLRTRQNGETETRTLVAGLSRNNVLRSGISASAQFNRFENRLSSGYQASLALARYVFQVLYLQAETGRSRYAPVTAESPVMYQWFHLAASSYLTRRLYASGYGEFYRGDAMDTNYFGVELGCRF